jgi:succinate dehydrogenase / fumarate reductase membrane anchor subunit
MAVNYGSKRVVVGAHYGLRDWLAQRVTAVLMAVFTLLLLVQVLFSVILAMLYHVWVGVRDIWMDYVKPVSIRLSLQVVSIVWLVGCAGWAIQVLWRL